MPSSAQSAPGPHARATTSASVGRVCSSSVASPAGVRRPRATDPPRPRRKVGSPPPCLSVARIPDTERGRSDRQTRPCCGQSTTAAAGAAAGSVVTPPVSPTPPTPQPRPQPQTPTPGRPPTSASGSAGGTYTWPGSLSARCGCVHPADRPNASLPVRSPWRRALSLASAPPRRTPWPGNPRPARPRRALPRPRRALPRARPGSPRHGPRPVPAGSPPVARPRADPSGATRPAARPASQRSRRRRRAASGGRS